MNPQQPDTPQTPDQPLTPDQPPVVPVPEVQPSPIVEPQAPVAPESQPQVAATPEVMAPEPVSVAPPVDATQPFAPTPIGQAAGAVPPQQPSVGGPAVFGTGPSPAPAKNNKMVMLIAAIIGGIVVIGLVVWALFAFVFNSIALESYKGEGYSVLVPKGYEKTESTSSVAFKEPNADSNEQSQVMVTSIPIKSALTVMSRSDIIKLYDDTFSEKTLSDNSGFSSSNTITNFKKDETTYQGLDARKITFDVEEDGKRSGTGHVLLVFGEDEFYAIIVAAHTSDGALEKAADKILNSLEINK